MAIDPERFVTYYDSGLGSIGSLTDSSVRGRFDFKGRRMAIKSARVHFSSGTGAVATLSMYSQSNICRPYRNTVLWDWTSRGLNADASVLMTDEELAHFIIEADEQLVFRWDDAASPDDMQFSIKIVALPL